MNSKIIISISFIVLSIWFIWSFSIPFKQIILDPLSLELKTLQDGYERISSQNVLSALRDKKNSLSEKNLSILNSYVPETIQSGKVVYNLSQIAIQNNLVTRNIQYSVVDITEKNSTLSKKLLVEFQFDGTYKDIVNWINQIEKANLLMEMESFKAGKVSNTSDLISATIKFSVYALNIE